MVDLFVDPDMPSTLASHRIALLDTSVRARREILPQALYVVVHGGDALLRRLREGARCAYLLTDRTEDNPVQWEPVELRTADPWHFVRARVLWLGSELDWDGPMDQRGRFL